MRCPSRVVDWRKRCLTLWIGIRDLKYRFRGDFIENDDQKVMLFQLDEPEMVKTRTSFFRPKKLKQMTELKSQGGQLSRLLTFCLRNGRTHLEDRLPASERLIYWSRGTMRLTGMFLRPAKELAEYSTLTSEDLEEPYMKQRKRIEGWPIPDEHGSWRTVSRQWRWRIRRCWNWRRSRCRSGNRGERRIEQTFDYDGYQVARRELFAHLRDPAIIIRKDSITFNTACIAGLEDVVYVNIMFNSDLKRLVVKGCNENDMDALRWCIAKPDKRASRKMSCRLCQNCFIRKWIGPDRSAAQILWIPHRVRGRSSLCV